MDVAQAQTIGAALIFILGGGAIGLPRLLNMYRKEKLDGAGIEAQQNVVETLDDRLARYDKRFDEMDLRIHRQAVLITKLQMMLLRFEGIVLRLENIILAANITIPGAVKDDMEHLRADMVELMKDADAH